MDMNFTGERFVPALRGQIYYEHFHRYAVALPMATDKEVLDVASGEGYGAAFLAMTARSVIGVDIDEASVLHAAARYPAMNLSFRVGSASQIPLPNASVDLITSFETLEHLAEHEQMLREMQRVLRSDGRLIISSPNRLVYSDERGYANPYHVRELYFNEFRALVQAYFPEVQMYAQRIFAACAIHPISGASLKTRWLGPSLASEAGMPRLPSPEYFVAVCGKNAGEKLPDISTVYLDPRDDLLNDIRSGGLAAPDAPSPMLVSASRMNEGILAIESAEQLGSGEIQKRIDQLQKELSEQTAATQAYVAEAERLTEESSLLSEQCRELEQLRLVQFERSEAAVRELRSARRLEAEGRLERDSLAADLLESTAQLEALRGLLLQTQAELTAARMRDSAFELLLSRVSGLQAALDEAQKITEHFKAELLDTKRSRSWQVTAPLRKAISLTRR